MVEFTNEYYRYALEVNGIKKQEYITYLTTTRFILKDGKEFSYTESSLTTFDLIEMRDFFNRLVTIPSVEEQVLSFNEFDASFSVKQLDDHHFFLKIHLIPGAKYLDWPYDDDEIDGMDLFFIVSSDIFKRAVSILNQWIEKFKILKLNASH